MRKLPVLLVEDNSDDERLTRRALRAYESVMLEVAHDGQEAIDFLCRCGAMLPALVLLDLKLPKQGGIDVLRWIRAKEGAACIPVVVFSSSAEYSDRLECERLHANSFVQKPLDFDSYLDTIRRTVDYWLNINIASPDALDRSAVDRSGLDRSTKGGCSISAP